jgi:two-component system OmpR family response regulator
MRVLVVEDEAPIAARLSAALEAAGFVVERAADGEDALHRGLLEDLDAVVLDLGLPRLDGLSVLKRWRAEGRTMPVIVLTARGSWHERVEGIDAGADDYLPKPFRMEELIARLRAVLRRARGHASPVLEAAGIELDTRTGRVSVDGLPVSLTALELRLLTYLMHHRDRIVGRAELHDHLYALDSESQSNTIEVIVGRLRRKLGGERIVTRRGLGYRIAEGDE